MKLSGAVIGGGLGVLMAAGLGAMGAAPGGGVGGGAAATGPGAGPGGGLGRGRGGARGGGVTVLPLADAEKVEKAPPLEKDGNYIIAPPWTNAPELTVKEGVAKGTITTFTLKSEESKFYNGIVRNGAAVPYERQVWVYVPAGYVAGTELPLMVDHDGRMTPTPAVIQSSLIAILDNMIAEKRIPMMAAVFVANGGDTAGASERSLEYDTVSGKYAEFLEAEVLPVAEKTGNVKFSKDPDKRGVIGQSSGSAAALGMAWFHNELYHRVISYSGTFVSVQNPNVPEYPHGAWAYHDNLIPQTEKKALRIWMEVGSRDNGATSAETGYRNWPMANNRMADVLKAKGYAYQYVWAIDAGHVEGGVERQTLAEAMEWVWKGDKVK